MPIQRFKCRNKDCEHEHRDIVKMDTNTKSCPKCNSECYRMIGSFNFHLKGGGWFKDGYTKPKK